ncbi:fimbrial protein [Pseudomonas fluorescens]|uniref:fimbrial protein n=1 Tax=Pseudomonas fluorescens TaxID=294 RepID=UPI001907158B|nr:fimbrial protein [Pseudomonas fluorescens]MBD8092554.1 fimbrial protein [Pseudomonas fluorescens]MBD8718522.1 fimbrial protein [Pseudomonas fluorescens]
MIFTLKNTFKILGILFVICGSQTAFSMTCSTALGGSTESLNMGALKISPAQVRAGTEIWRSATITRQFLCSERPNGLNEDTLKAFFFLDPLGEVARLDPSLQVGVTYLGIHNRVSYGSRINLGTAVNCTPFCEPGSTMTAYNRYYALPISVSFQVYVKLSGTAPPGSGKINIADNLTVLRIAGGDDKLGNLPAINFATTLSGLKNVSFMSCQPTITVTGNNGATVGFGSISLRDAVPNKIQKQVPFSVNVNMSDADNSQACPGTMMRASFSTTYTLRDQTTILPSSNSGFGIVLSRAATPNVPIVMNSIMDMGIVSGGTVVQNRFTAGLKWLSATPKIGPFTASANVDITFK